MGEYGACHQDRDSEHQAMDRIQPNPLIGLLVRDTLTAPAELLDQEVMPWLSVGVPAAGVVRAR